MRFLLAGILATLTAAGLAAIRPAVVSDEERAAAATIRESRMRADVRFLGSDLLEGRAPGTRGDRLARAYRRLAFRGHRARAGRSGRCLGAAVRPRGHRVLSARDRARLEGGRERGLALPDGLRRRVRRPGGEGAARRGRDRVRRVRDRRPGAGLGRLQGGGPPRTRAPVPEQRAGGGPAAVRREAPALLRALGLQVRDGGEARRGRSPRPPHGRLRGLRVEGRPELLDRRAALPARVARRARRPGEGMAHGGRGPARRPPRRPRPRGPARRGGATRLPPGAARRAPLARAREHDLPPDERERGRPAARPRPRALARGGRLHRPPRPPGREAGRVGRDGRVQRRARQRLGRRRPAGRGRGLRGAPRAAAPVDPLRDGRRGGARPPRIGPPGAAPAGARGPARGERQHRRREHLGPHPRRPRGRPRQVVARRLDPRPRGDPGPGRGPGGVAGEGRLLPLGPPQLRPHRGALGYLDAGTDVLGKPPGWGRARQREWEEANYHQPTDDLTAEWDFSGAVEDARLLFHLGSKVADAPLLPAWRPGDEFEAARKKALAELEP